MGEPAVPSCTHEVVEISVDLPDAAARARAQRIGRKAMAEVSLLLDSGDRREIVVPARVGRLLQDGAVELPREEDDAFDAVHALEGRVCFAMLTEMLARRDHAESEIRRKLSSYGFRDIEIEGSISRARELRFLNDDRFASYFIEERVRRGWGRRRIEAELSRRGVDAREVPGYPDAFFTEEGDLERLRALLARRRVPEQRAYEKLVRFLVSRGFPFGVAADAVRERLSQQGE